MSSTEQVKHGPLPWTCELRDGAYVILDAGGGKVVRLATMLGNHGAPLARYIVKAANLFPELVAACGAALGDATDEWDKGVLQQTTRDRIRAILEKAKA